MKTILCYGDSNTWGYDPRSGKRYGPKERWPGVLGEILGDTFYVAENGIGGRSAVWDNPYIPGLNGKDGLIYALMSTRPIDLVILMLGTNDLKYTDAVNVAKAQQTLIRMMKGAAVSINIPYSVFTNGKPEILLVSPPHLGETLGLRHTIEPYFTHEESAKLAEYYRMAAQEEGIHFLDAAQYASPSQIDGMHMLPEGHLALGRAIAERVTEILPAD